MRRLRRFAAFWYDFVVGDDWRVAVGVVTLLGTAAVLAQYSVPVWFLLPVGVATVLVASVWRTVRRSVGVADMAPEPHSAERLNEH